MALKRPVSPSDIGRYFLVHFEDGHWSVLRVVDVKDLRSMDAVYLPGVQMEFHHVSGWRPSIMGRRLPHTLSMTPVDELDQFDQHIFIEGR